MLKAVKKPKEYAVIKVPSDCKDVGKFVHEEFESNGTQIKVITQYDPKAVTRVGKDQNRVNPGDVIVDDYSFLNGHMLHVMSQKDFEKEFKPVDNNNKLGGMSSSMDIDTTTAQRAPQAINAKMSTAVSIEKQPHVRIEFDDINDVPHVWIDGKQVDSQPNNVLVSVSLIWHTRDQVIENGNQGQYKIEYLDLDGQKRIGIAQGNLFSNELLMREKREKIDVGDLIYIERHDLMLVLITTMICKRSELDQLEKELTSKIGIKTVALNADSFVYVPDSED